MNEKKNVNRVEEEEVEDEQQLSIVSVCVFDDHKETKIFFALLFRFWFLFITLRMMCWCVKEFI